MGIITFHFVCFGWIFFRAEDFMPAMKMINQILSILMQVFSCHSNENYKEVLWMIAWQWHFTFPDDAAEKLITKTKPFPLVIYIIIFFAF